MWSWKGVYLDVLWRADHQLVTTADRYGQGGVPKYHLHLMCWLSSWTAWPLKMALHSSKKCQEPLAQQPHPWRCSCTLTCYLTWSYLNCWESLLILCTVLWLPFMDSTSLLKLSGHCQVYVLHAACHSSTSPHKTSLLSFKYQQNVLTICDTAVTLLWHVSA